MKNLNKSVHEAHDEWSAAYDSDINLTRDLDQTVTRRTFEGIHFHSILEIGCGTGKNTRLLSRIGGSVHAVDFSRGMLAVARQGIRASNVQFVMADITKKWPNKGQSYDLILCNLVLEHIEELSWVFSEAARSLKHKGRLFVCELHPFRQYQGKKATFQWRAQQIEIPAHLHLISDYLEAGKKNGLLLLDLKEWWHAEDQGEAPRLVSFMFEN
jgi:ubiquinone/menaquinone biosynthesis C-methylase UbiE